jgi:hypothetical protein
MISINKGEAFFYVDVGPLLRFCLLDELAARLCNHSRYFEKAERFFDASSKIKLANLVLPPLDP